VIRSVRPAAVFLLVLLPCVAPDVARAQSSLQFPLQFDFINPGAKSKAMGGAFAGVADDATATFANPAGLMQVLTPEVSLEGRYSRFESPFLERGRLSGSVFDQGTDTVQGPLFADATVTDKGLGFASVVYARPLLRWRVAAYRHELVRIDQSLQSNGVFQQAAEEFTSRREAPLEGMREVSVTSYGVSAAYGLPRRVYVGAGVAFHSFSLRSRFRRLDTVGFSGPPNPAAQERGRSTQSGDDVGVSASVGALVELGERGRLGVTYRHGPSFRFDTLDGDDPLRESTFRIPSTAAVGASFKPTPGLTLAVEVTRVQFSRLRRDFVIDQALGAGLDDSFTIDNGTELHGGVEYLPLTPAQAPRLRFAPAFRAGIWFDPDHSVKFDPPRPAVTIGDRLAYERHRAALSTGKDLVHYTAGVGLSLTARLEVNAALDASARTRIVAMSFIVR
jgi:hypothetical protein